MLWISLVITHPAQHFPSKLLISPGKRENNPRETGEKHWKYWWCALCEIASGEEVGCATLTHLMIVIIKQHLAAQQQCRCRNGGCVHTCATPNSVGLFPPHIAQ